MFKKIRYLFCIVSITSISNAFAQNPGQAINPTVKRDIPPSPTSAALGKYGDIPVNESAGLPSISIPLYTLPTNEFSLPVSLSYHAGGIKVEEDASWVGLGWSLNAGGVITRTMHGKPDEDGYTAGDGALIPANGNISSNNANGFNLLKRITKNEVDVRPDEYFFNFGKYTGKFVMAPNGDIRLIPYSKLKVIKQTIGGNITFSITTEDGTIYQFNATETTEAIASEDLGHFIPQYISSWYLTSITSPRTTNVITFNYSTYIINRSKNVFYTQYWKMSKVLGLPYLQNTSISYNAMGIKGVHLASINYSNGRIEFIPKNEVRQDVPGDQALETIKIYGSNNQLIKSWKLQYTYYNNNSSDPLDKRLQLQQVQEVGTNGNLLSPYIFNYNALPLPSIASKAQDHWGFYNGKFNITLVPAGSLGTVIISGADREIDAAYVKAGILEKITYPTGGNTTFEFESNTTGSIVPIIKTMGASVTCNCWPAEGVYTCKDESSPFKINSIDGIVELYVDLKPSPTNIAKVTLINTATNTEEVLDPGHYVRPDMVGNTYKLVAETIHDEPTLGNDYASCRISWKESEGTVKSQIAPGLRIKKISSSDGIAGSLPLVTKYGYNTFTDNTQSSGGLSGGKPIYEYWFQEVNTLVFGSEVTYLIRTSHSQSDLGNGSTVSYANVKKIIGENGENGSVNSYYSIFPSEGGGGYPFPPKIDKNYKNGLLIRQTTFNNTGQAVKDITNTYTYRTDNNYSSIPGLIVGYYKRNIADYGSTGMDFQSNKFFTFPYSYISEWFYLSATNTITYDQNGSNGSSVKIDYIYGNPLHCQPNNITTTVENSGTSKQLINRILYPQDYTLTGTLSGTAAVLKNMADRNIINVPIEQFTISAKGWDFRVVEGQLNSYKLNTGLIAKDKDYNLKFNNTSVNQDLIAFAPSSINSARQFIFDPHYEETNAYNKYDAVNNLLELKDRKNIYGFIREPGTGAIWAKAVHSSFAEIAYSSFEHTIPSNFTNWNYNVTGIVNTTAYNGKKAFNLSVSAITSFQVLSTSQTYKISFWRQSGALNINTTQPIALKQGATHNGWTYFEGTFSNASQVKLSGNAVIDELRLYPVSSQMTTYLYQQETGITSQCNENNQKTDYLYDEFNRLKIVKDQDGNILKKNEYKYQASY